MGVTMSRHSCCYCSGCSYCGTGRLFRLLRGVVYSFQWKIESVRRDQAQLEDEPNTKIVKGIVTSCEDDYGWIEDCIFFSTGVVIGHVSVQIGDKVLAFVEEDPLSHDLKATEVCVFLEDDKLTEPYSKIQVLSACVSDVKKDIIHVADEYYFYLDSISKAILGFTPYEGDWLDIEYSVEQGSSKIIVQSLKATKHRHLEEARVTSIHRRQGLLNHSIFFTLNSLKCPLGYTPLVGHVVNAVIVQSIRSHYSWRAIAMSPVKVL
ncbi:cancer/testis antigen 55-like [Microtus oregoni]|uniref:cancer/testis antigen 55-like n=1 Tax=Microtus oregoni TaxID=111838 RepID=UPI001BB2A660|nr:cancer/testis antigen 55-like [Microtus oregoni]